MVYSTTLSEAKRSGGIEKVHYGGYGKTLSLDQVSQSILKIDFNQSQVITVQHMHILTRKLLLHTNSLLHLVFALFGQFNRADADAKKETKLNYRPTHSTRRNQKRRCVSKYHVRVLKCGWFVVFCSLTCNNYVAIQSENNYQEDGVQQQQNDFPSTLDVSCFSLSLLIFNSI